MDNGYDVWTELSKQRKQGSDNRRNKRVLCPPNDDIPQLVVHYECPSLLFHHEMPITGCISSC
uniref:Uncharacterized protein n=1 Tax=Arion vulgaris TaxID=1028688 RepID=A0A0B6ZKE3_9EUPU